MDFNKTLIQNLGIEITCLEKGYVEATMPVDERTRQPFGYLHGGASVALAETIASIGAYELVDKDLEGIVGLEINANHIKGIKEGMVTGVGKVLHKGKSTMVWEIQIVDGENHLICISRCTIAIIKKQK